MKIVFECEIVRQLYYREGLSKREISRRAGFYRKTISKMLRYSTLPGSPQRETEKECQSNNAQNTQESVHKNEVSSEAERQFQMQAMWTLISAGPRNIFAG
jgi:transposase